MRTTLDLPDGLLAAAQKACGAKTKTMTVVIALQQLVNAAKIIAVDIRESQLEFAMKFGATHSVNASDRDPVAQVKELTGGLGADYTFEVFGSTDTIRAAYDMCRKSGTVTVLGIAPIGAEASIDAVDLAE